MRATPGRIVIYRDDETEWPAIVTKADEPERSICLTVFKSYTTEEGVWAREGDSPYTWHWPDRAA